MFGFSADLVDDHFKHLVPQDEHEDFESAREAVAEAFKEYIASCNPAK